VSISRQKYEFPDKINALATQFRNLATKNGFLDGDWLRIREFAGTLAGGPVNYIPRPSSGIIHDHIEKFVLAQFSGRQAIRVDDFNGIFGMVLQDRLFIRIKLKRKSDGKGRKTGTDNDEFQ
jgi:hypothetical protein